MATYRITAPDGNEYDVEAPDSASEADVMAYAQSQYASVPGRSAAAPAPTPAAAPDDAIARYQAATAATPAAAPAPAAPRPAPAAAAPARTATGNPRVVDLAGRALTQGIAALPDAATRGASIVTGLLPGAGALSPFNPVNPRSVAQFVRGQKVEGGVPAPSVRGTLSEALTARGVPQPETPVERIASTATEGLAGGLVTGGGATIPIIGGALGGGAAQSAAELGAPDWLQQAIGLVAGLVPGGARAAAGRSPRELQSTVDRVTEAGGQIRRGGALPGPVSDTTRALPGSGGRANYKADVKDLNNRVADTIGAKPGTQLPERYAEARNRATSEFDDFARNESLVLTQPLVNELLALAQSTKQVGGAPATAATKVIQALTEAAQTGKTVPGGTRVSGDLFKRLDTELGAIEGAGAAKSALRQQFMSTLPPQRAAQWTDLMRRYGDLSSIEGLAKKYWSVGKEIPPQELLAATSSKGYGQQRRTAMGERGRMGDLAAEGQYIRAPRMTGPQGAVLGAGATGAGMSLGPASALPLYGSMAMLGRLADAPLLSSRQMGRVVGETGLGGAVGATTKTTPPPKKGKKK